MIGVIGSRLIFPAEQRLALLDAIDELEAVNTTEGLAACFGGVMQEVFPHGGLGMGVGRFVGEEVRFQRVLFHNFPRQAVEALRQPNGRLNSPLLSRWREQRSPVLVDQQVGNPSWLRALSPGDYGNVAAHGVVDHQGDLASFFCFIRIPEQLGEKHVYLLRRLIPYLHVAAVRAMTISTDAVSPLPNDISLDSRQKEILGWLCCGKSNPEIAGLMGTSEQSVEYHLEKIFTKLSIFSRDQAVRKALALGLIKQ